ncbi:hypothetical protein [Desulfosediminicola sp.]|uniref:hypothetical protein n=1 Tax=Desulfosediminicola sp. TaxID=2886825 RepID=UPI003AF2B7F6
METFLIPQADTIPASWGWFQFLLLLTFPLHLLAMNAMLGGLVIGVMQHINGGELQKRLAHRVAIATPLLIALVVNLGVAPFLFLQVLYGQFIYTSSILMGLFWILVIPVLILAYSGGYLYDFKFAGLGRFGIVVGGLCCLAFLAIAAMFSNNMLLMVSPGKFSEYFASMNGTMLLTDSIQFWPRYLHMVVSALAIGGLAVALLGRFQAERDLNLADHATALGLRTFWILTLVNIPVGALFLMSLPKEQMMLFMGRDMGATVAFGIGLLLTLGAVVTGIRRKLWLTIMHVVLLVYVMVFMRAWLRSDYLRQHFTLDQLELVPQYSPMIFFFATLGLGVICLVWLWRTTAKAMA